MNKESIIESLESMQAVCFEVVGEAILMDASKTLKSQKMINRTKKRKKLAFKFRAIAGVWFDEIREGLSQLDVSAATLESIDTKIQKILSEALFNFIAMNETIAVTFVLLKSIHNLILHVYTLQNRKNDIDAVVDLMKLATESEKTYLEEAHECGRIGCFKAAVILGWSATVDRMQRTIENLGFETFNKKSREMKNKTSGRYKRFNKEFDVSSLGELRASVFDTDLLWILEYWGLIDSNQHQRLNYCHTMRCNAAHPGEAAISRVNLDSFFSDIRGNIFANPNFAVKL